MPQGLGKSANLGPQVTPLQFSVLYPTTSPIGTHSSGALWQN